MRTTPPTARLFTPIPAVGDPIRQLVAAAEQELGQGRFDTAQTLLQRALQLAPDDAAVNGTLAVLALSQGQVPEAITLARHAVQRAPAQAQHHFTLGRAHKAAGALDAAVAAYRLAIEQRPLFAEAHVSLGLALKELGDLHGAIACHRRAIEINANLAVAHSNLGAALAAQAELDADADDDGLPNEDSIAALQRAAALAPGDATVQRNLGAILLRAGRPAQAMHAFNAALTLQPADRESCVHLGSCLVDLGEHALAAQLGQKWLASNALDPAVLRGLVSSLTMVGEVDAALSWSQRALDLQPDAMAQALHGNALLQARRIPEGVQACRASVDASGQDVALYPTLLMGLNYLHEQPEPIFAAHRELHERLEPLRVPVAARPRQAGEALRVGFVSADFVNHSVAFFMEPLLRHLDASAFQVTCYHNNARSDAVTQRLQALGHRWVPCAQLSDAALARRIRADGIDVLVDLGGMTAQSRMLVFAEQAAPVQIGYLGYPTVSGIPGLAWRLTDHEIDPGDMPDFPSEQPLALPRSMFCYQPLEAPALAPPPALKLGHITFGSFNNVAKLTDSTLRLWAAVLHAVPGSRLLLKATAITQALSRSSIEAVMAQAGITPDRLTLMARQEDQREHLAVYNDVDIALDSVPYNGATTTCEALWMGLPVVTRRGATHTARMGASILGALGRSDWVARADDDFVRIAAGLAADPAALAAWRAGARAQMAASALCDGAAMARAFEAALAQAWAAAARGDQAPPPNVG